jgi:hypothetical protein
MKLDKDFFQESLNPVTTLLEKDKNRKKQDTKKYKKI